MNLLISAVIILFNLQLWTLTFSHNVKVLSFGSLPDFSIFRVITDGNGTNFEVSGSGVLVYLTVFILLLGFAFLIQKKMELRKASYRDLLHCFIAIVVQALFFALFQIFSKGFPVPYLSSLYSTFGNMLVYLTIFLNTAFWISLHISKLKLTKP